MEEQPTWPLFFWKKMCRFAWILETPCVGNMVRGTARKRKEVSIMKNREMLSEAMLCMVWGGTGIDGAHARDPYIDVPDSKGHGKTQPGGNEDIFAGK